MQLHFIIIGYYEHYNFGDDQYKKSFSKLLSDYIHSEYTVDFYNCDKLHEYSFNETDIIIIGGGDILNPYFLNKINKRFKNLDNLIIAFSVGLPYTNTLIETDLLNIIDYIFLRTVQDLKIFKKYFDKDRVFYIPDLSYILSSYYNTERYTSVKELRVKQFRESKLIQRRVDSAFILKNVQDTTNTGNTINDTELKLQNIKKSSKIMCLCLSRHIYNKNYQTEYNTIIRNLCKFIEWAIDQNYHIILLPFNTNKDNSSENDILINKDIMDILINLITNKDIIDDLITNIDVTLSEIQLQKIMTSVDVSICMRFHSVLFSIYNNVPFIPIYTTRKIRNLLLDIGWDYEYRLPTNEKFIPVDFDENVVKDLLCKLNMQLNKNIYQELLYTNTNFDKMFSKNIKRFTDIITSDSEKRNVNQTNVDEIITKTYNSVISFCQNRGISSSNFRCITDSHLQNIIASIICYNLIGIPNSEYNWGLCQKIFSDKDYDFANEWKWIINDWINRADCSSYSNPNGLFNINYIDQIDHSGVHRSGWQYVYDNIVHLHKDDSDLLLDLYIDRTFHWNREFNKHVNIIPYKKNWFGVIHHTFDTTFSNYNCHRLLQCQEFTESLSYCKGLIVLSVYLQRELENELQKINMDNIKVYYITHPTEIDVEKFTPKKFFQNEDKALLHIGGWLRNVYSFYDISIPKYINCKTGFLLGDSEYTPLKYQNDPIKKVALRGKHTSNYYPHPDFLIDLKKMLSNNKINCSGNCLSNCSSNCLSNCSSNCSGYINESCITNNWNLHFYENMYNKIKSVNFIDYITDTDYDALITKNIVYINLVDASAVNTIIECIVRHTPIIVNKHPAVVELLGEKYPLYHSNNNEICELLKSDKLIRKAYHYLKKLNCETFSIGTFLKNFQKIISCIKKL
jgi:hypothetical protein